MFLLLASLVTLASAAPHTQPEAHFTRSSLKEYSRTILPSADNIGITMDNYNILYNSVSWTITTTDKQYILSMPMSGYNKEDIVVMAHRGLLVMRAIKKERGDIKQSQLAISFLPVRVKPEGRWTYQDGELTVALAIDGRVQNVDNTIRDDGGSDVLQLVVNGN